MISVWDVDTIYKVPRMLHAQGLDELICAKLQLHTKPANLTRWDKLVDEVEHPQHEVTIAMCGKYVELSDSYKSLNEALRHAGIHNHARVKIEYDRLGRPDRRRTSPTWRRFDAILVPGGFGKRGVEGKILAAQFARENEDPLPRHLPRHAGRDDRVRAPQGGPRRREQHRVRPGDAEHPVIALIDEWEDRRRLGAEAHRRSPTSAAPCAWARRAPTSSPARWRTRSTATSLTERHRHRYEANENYLDRLDRGRPRDLGDHPARAS